MTLCRKSNRESISWDKFRDNDTKGIFNRFSNGILSVKFRILKFIELGLCWNCGKNEPIYKDGVCEKCKEHLHILSINFHQKKD